MASSTSYVSSRRWRVRLAWVCARSHGQASPQGAHELVEAHQLGGDRLGQLGDPEGCQVVGLDGAIEVVPGHGAHRLVGQTQALQDHDLVRAVLHAQLDVGQHVELIALAHEQRPPLPGRLHLEAAAVDEAGAEGDGVDAQPGPGQVEV